jgi:hypothetical protein
MVRTRLKRNKNLISSNVPGGQIESPGTDAEAARRGLKVMLQPLGLLTKEGRDDFDYYEPTKELEDFPSGILIPLDKILTFRNENRNPADDERPSFKYVEISAIDTETGEIKEAIEIPCDEELVPDRARIVIHSGDIIISTVRPTRRAIAYVPEQLDNEICSTGFSVIRANPGVDPDYLLYILRTDLVAKQFGKFASGSSYPAITDKHIRMTLVPLPGETAQRSIATMMRETCGKIRDLHTIINKTLTDFNVKSKEILLSSNPEEFE